MAPWPLIAVIYHAARSGDADWLKAISIAILFFLFLPVIFGVAGTSGQILAWGTLIGLLLIGRKKD